jgi:hypothetical protein
MTLVGLSERFEGALRVSRESLVAVTEVASVLGLAFGVAGIRGTSGNASAGAVRRRAILGTAGSALILLVTQLGAIAGAVSGRRAEAELDAAITTATHGYPGWNGGARLADGATLYAVEIDNASAFAQMALKQYRRPYRMLFVGADNRRGARELTLELTGARTVQSDGAVGNAVLHAETREPEEGSVAPRLVQPSTLRVPRGETYEGALVLFPPDQSFRDVQWLKVRINGKPDRIPGRFFTLEEKRAIDATRRQATPR